MSAGIPTNALGTAGPEVTRLGFGAMEIRGVEHRLPRVLEPGQAAELLNTVLDVGINFIDTSIDYGDSERLIGEHIAHRRDEYVLATKCGCPLDAHEMTDAPTDRPLPHDFRRQNIVAGVEQSLRRLRTDRIDLLQVHANPSRSVIESDGVIETLHDLRSAGKVRWIGISTELPAAIEHIDMGAFDAFQLPYSALNRRHEEVIERAAGAGAGVIVRGGVSQGIPGDGRASTEVWARWEDASLDDLLDLGSRLELMLRFALSDPSVHTTIIGTARPEHVRANALAAARGPLPADVVAEMKARLTAVSEGERR